MDKRLLFVIFIYFLCKPQSKAFPDLPPELKMYPAVISAETNSVTLTCMPPSSAPVSGCYFIVEGGETIHSSSCQMTLTVTELLVKKGQSLPAEVQVKCFYTPRRGEEHSYSLHSNTLIIHIQSSDREAPELTVTPQTISETEPVTLRCQPPPPVSAPQCYFYTAKGGSPKVSSCVETLTGSELLLMSQQSSPAVVQVQCFYNVQLGHRNYQSAHSNLQVIMIHSFNPVAPKLTVTPQTISVTESVTLRCQPPPSVSAPQCHFYTMRGGSPKVSSCVEKLTGRELLLMSQQSSPAVVQVQCFYNVQLGHRDYQSAHSDLQVIMIHSPNPVAPELTVTPQTISVTESVTLRCQPPPSVSAPQCHFYTMRGGSPKVSSCVEKLTGSELLLMSQQSSPAVVQVQCFYTVRLGEGDLSSLQSNTMFIHIQTSAAPKLTVTPQTISETEPVTLRCQPPPPVSAPQCYFYTVKGGSPKVLSCVETLTGSELLLMSQQSSPAVVQVQCFYNVQLGHRDYQSAHSDLQAIMIHSAQPHLAAHYSPGEDVQFVCSLPGSANKDTTCNLYFGDETVQRPFSFGKSRMNEGWYCQFYVLVNDLLKLSPQQRDASCDYSLKEDPSVLSPRSERYNLADFVKLESEKTSKQPSVTQTTSQTSSTVQGQWWVPSPTTTVNEIVPSVSKKTHTQPSVTQTTSQTSSTVQTGQRTPSPPTTVKNIVDSKIPSPPSVTQATSQTSSTPSPNILRGKVVWIVGGLTFFGVVIGANFLGWLFIRRENCFNKRTRGNVSNDSIDMEVVGIKGAEPAGKNQKSDVMASNEVCCPGTKEREKGRQDNEGECHVYHTINDMADRGIQNDMVYSLLQAH